MHIQEVENLILNAAPDKVYLVTDSNVAKIATSLISVLTTHPLYADTIITPAGEENKSWNALEKILTVLSNSGATRRSLLICIGGGMTTDIGGFAAAIFKRGIRHINIATTLLAAVDAAVGGKTGIDFNGLKNEIGAFHHPLASLFDIESFKSLPDSEFLSGFGEVIKTAFLASEEMTRRLLASEPFGMNEDMLAEVCAFCRDEKLRVVNEDPTEKGLRKILNFGHTAGHAFEAICMEKGSPVSHGAAVAHGILPALILSHTLKGMEKKWITLYTTFLHEYYQRLPISCDDYSRLLEIAMHDKKNSSADTLNFTLLTSPGSPIFDIPVTPAQFREAIDLYLNL